MKEACQAQKCSKNPDDINIASQSARFSQELTCSLESHPCCLPAVLQTLQRVTNLYAQWDDSYVQHGSQKEERRQERALRKKPEVSLTTNRDKILNLSVFGVISDDGRKDTGDCFNMSLKKYHTVQSIRDIASAHLTLNFKYPLAKWTQLGSEPLLLCL